jgi:uncharacterized protein (TIGR04255 family)
VRRSFDPGRMMARHLPAPPRRTRVQRVYWLIESAAIARPPSIRRGLFSLQMTYPNAPITEAVMDIRVQSRDDLEVEELRSLAKGSGEEFLQTNERFSIRATITGGSPVATQTTTPTKVGFEFRNSTGDRVLGAQIDGWSFSKLTPYEKWEVFQRQGRNLWNKYRDLARPKQIQRAALRYVNRLDLPLPIDDFKQYLRTVPEIAPDLPQGLSNFFLQAQIPQIDDQRGDGAASSTNRRVRGA